jgi:hypothetical protein
MTDLPPLPHRGDKFAALQQQKSQKPVAPKRDKFAAMQSRNDAAVSSQPHQDEPIRPDQSHVAQLQKQKFSKVWDDLQQAEAATLRLLQLARETAESLVNADTLDDNENKHQTPPTDDFLETLHKVHALLSPHASLVKAYVAPTEPNKTYLAKVELGMARQKRNVIQAWNKLLEEQDNSDFGVEEPELGAAGGGGPLAATVESNTLETAGSKRKRDDGVL